MISSDTDRLATCATFQSRSLSPSRCARQEGLLVKQLTVSAWLLLVLALAVDFSAISAVAQDPNPVVQTNELSQAEAMDGIDDPGTVDDLSGTNQVSESNSLGQASSQGPDARTRRLQRLRRARKNNAGQQNGTGLPGSTNGAGPLDYAAFRLVTERNIFDPNRQPHTPGARSQPKTDSFTLVGTMSYDKGDFAFFDGITPDYKKVLKPADTIAGYKVVAILQDSVKLEKENKNLDLPVGSQLRHQEDGTWVQAAGAGSYAASSAAGGAPASDTASSGADSDILKRLMQRREKENSP